MPKMPAVNEMRMLSPRVVLMVIFSLLATGAGPNEASCLVLRKTGGEPVSNPFRFNFRWILPVESLRALVQVSGARTS